LLIYLFVCFLKARYKSIDEICWYRESYMICYPKKLILNILNKLHTLKDLIDLCHKFEYFSLNDIDCNIPIITYFLPPTNT